MPVIGVTADIMEDSFVLARAYVEAVIEAGGLPIVLAAPADGMYARNERDQSAERCGGRASAVAAMLDGLLIPGGGDLAPRHYGEDIAVDGCLLKPVSEERIRFERSLIEAMTRGVKPVLAICYGMQLLNVCFGGTLYQDIRTQRPDSLDHSGGGHQIECEPFCEGLGASPWMVNTSHHQAVKSLGGGLDVIARADDGIIEGIRLSGHPFVIGVQWHPERGGDPLSARLFREFISHARKCAEGRPALA